MARQGRDCQRFGADGARLVAGCVPLLNGKVVLICNRKNRDKWGLPKGGWEDDEPTACEAALREAFEEAGVRCVPGASLADTRVDAKARSGKPAVQVQWFACYVTELVGHWPEAAERDRKAVPLVEALRLVTRPEQRAALLEVWRFEKAPG